MTGLLLACLLVAGCTLSSAPSGATSSRRADLQRLTEHVTQLDSLAAAMAATAAIGAVADAGVAKQDFSAMEVIALKDMPWLPSADLPPAVTKSYKTLLSNIDLNASKLVDGSPNDYFLFLGSKLAPLWRQDAQKILAVVAGSTDRASPS